VTDVLWAAIEPLLPPEPPKPRGGRPRCDNRLALASIIFVLRSGIPWEMLPRELCCSGMTCWRRFRDWQEAAPRPGSIACSSSVWRMGGTWTEPGEPGQRLCSGEKGEPRPVRTRQIAGRSGRRKRHLVADQRGTPLGVRLSPANRPDSLMLAPTLDAVPGVECGRGAAPQTPQEAPRPVRPTTTGAAARSAAPDPSRPASPDGAWKRAKGWAGTDGVSRDPRLGSTASAASPSASSAGPTSTKPV
jgi:Putative transposase of IS4/5 family (DUF4096)